MAEDASKKFFCKLRSIRKYLLFTYELSVFITYRRKYQNILQCEENFNQMTDACGALSHNVQSMHGSLVRINTDYLVQIAEILNQMQLETVDQDEEISQKNTINNVVKDVAEAAKEESKAGQIINQLKEILQNQEVIQDENDKD